MSSRHLCFAAALLSACCGASSAFAEAVPVEVRHAAVAGGFSEVPNRLYATVEVCDADRTCIQVPDVVVDTASVGLRVNRAALGDLRLPEVTDLETGTPLRACGRLPQGTIWGDVVEARVGIGALSTRWAIPIQTYTVQTGRGRRFDAPVDCGDRDEDLAQSGVLAGNGVLGIGPQRNDCQFTVQPGVDESPEWERLVGACPLTPTDARYFVATPYGRWVPVEPPPSQRLPNPVVAFPVGHDDGVVLRLAAVPDKGSPSARGQLGLGFDASSLAWFATAPRALPFETWPTLPINVDGERVKAEFSSSAQTVEFSKSLAKRFDIKRATVEHPRELHLSLDPVEPDWFDLLLNPLLAQQQLAPRPLATLRVFDIYRSSGGEELRHNAAQPGAATIGSSALPVITLGLPFFYGRTLGIGLPSPEYPRGYLLY